MGNIVKQLAEALRMATELPWYAALPLDMIGYGLGILLLVKAAAAVIELLQSLL